MHQDNGAVFRVAYDRFVYGISIAGCPIPGVYGPINVGQVYAAQDPLVKISARRPPKGKFLTGYPTQYVAGGIEIFCDLLGRKVKLILMVIRVIPNLMTFGGLAQNRIGIPADPVANEKKGCPDVAALQVVQKLRGIRAGSVVKGYRYLSHIAYAYTAAGADTAALFCGGNGHLTVVDTVDSTVNGDLGDSWVTAGP